MRGQFSALGAYYFFGLLMHDSCLSTFSCFEVLGSWHNRLPLTSPSVCIISSNSGLCALEVRRTSEPASARWRWRQNHKLDSNCLVRDGGRWSSRGSCWRQKPLHAWTCGEGFSQHGWERWPGGEADLRGDAGHVEQTPDQVLVGRQPVGDQENTTVLYCH